MAAIVIPNMFKAYQQYQMVSKLKVAYSLISNVVDQSEIENGPISTWTTNCNNNTCRKEIFDKYYRPYLKIAKDCGVGSNTIGDNNKNNWCFWGPSGRIKGLGTKNEYVENYYKVILKNGMSMGVYPYSESNRHYIAFDIDGNKGNSIAGKDVFFFTVIRNTTTGGGTGNKVTIQKSQLYPGQVHWFMFAEKSPSSTVGWRTEAQNLTSETKSVKTNCTKDVTLYSNNEGHPAYIIQGGLCANAIIYNGWKVPNWYPW